MIQMRKNYVEAYVEQECEHGMIGPNGLFLFHMYYVNLYNISCTALNLFPFNFCPYIKTFSQLSLKFLQNQKNRPRIFLSK